MARQSQPEGNSTPAYWRSLATASGFDVQAAASVGQMSRRQLHRLCRRELGMSLQDWFRAQRVEAGRRWLLASGSVKRAALEAGYRQSSHFSREFKRMHGLTPSEYVIQRSGEAPKNGGARRAADVLRR